tara:strand:- start:1871 stop:2038 length:168 start_codon:yes stop_codon:yes gene_type:complete
MSVENIVKIDEGATCYYPMYERRLTGTVLHMKDGSRWFHPYNGAPPVELKKGRQP